MIFTVLRLTALVLTAAVFLLALLMTCGYLLERTQPGWYLMVGAWVVFLILLLTSILLLRWK